MKILRKLFSFLSIVFLSISLFAQDEDTFSITKHTVEKNPGTWIGFSANVNAQQNLTTLGLEKYELIFNPDFQIKGSSNVLYVVRFEETGQFSQGMKSQLPKNTHMMFIVDGSPSPEFKVKPTAYRFEPTKIINKFLVVIPKIWMEKMVTARTVRGLLYFRSIGGSAAEKNDVKSFTLDAKTLRTLSKLFVDAK
jgi:hypothetical protein